MNLLIYSVSGVFGMNPARYPKLRNAFITDSMEKLKLSLIYPNSCVQFIILEILSNMGLFPSKLSYEHSEILRHSTGLKAEELRPVFGKIPTYVFEDRRAFQKHVVPDSIAFHVIRGEYIVSSKSTFGGKVTYHL